MQRKPEDSKPGDEAGPPTEEEDEEEADEEEEPAASDAPTTDEDPLSELECDERQRQGVCTPLPFPPLVFCNGA